MRIALLMFVIALAYLGSRALADESPRDPLVIKLTGSGGKEIFGQKARRQYCYSGFEIDESGNWKSYTRFSNGRSVDGDNFQSILTVKDKNGNACLAVSHVRGMRGSAFCKGSCERTVNSSGKIDMSSHDVSPEFGYVCTGWDSTDDLLVATGAVVKLGCAIAGGGWSCATLLPTDEAAQTDEKPKKPPLCAPA
jgi:hypothetical protein